MSMRQLSTKSPYGPTTSSDKQFQVILSYVIISIQQFQLISSQSTYDAMILFEVTHNNPGTEVAFKESDIEVIEELTSAIDEPS